MFIGLVSKLRLRSRYVRREAEPNPAEAPTKRLLLRSRCSSIELVEMTAGISPGVRHPVIVILERAVGEEKNVTGKPDGATMKFLRVIVCKVVGAAVFKVKRSVEFGCRDSIQSIWRFGEYCWVGESGNPDKVRAMKVIFKRLMPLIAN